MMNDLKDYIRGGTVGELSHKHRYKIVTTTFDTLVFRCEECRHEYGESRESFNRRIFAGQGRTVRPIVHEFPRGFAIDLAATYRAIKKRNKRELYLRGV